MSVFSPAPPQGHACLTLGLWAPRWSAGRAAPDAVVDALSGWAPVHTVRAADDRAADATGLPGPGEAPETGIVPMLGALRALGPGLRFELALPVPGDVTGTVAGTAHAGAALAAGQTLLIHRQVPGTEVCSDCVGLVPSSAQEDVLEWTAFHTGCTGRPAPGPDSGAGHALRSAVRRAADLSAGLARRGQDGVDARREIAAAIEDADLHPVPADLPGSVHGLLDSAATVAAIITVVDRFVTTRPLAAGDAHTHDEVLRSLVTAVRRARIDAVHAVGAPAGVPTSAQARPAPRRDDAAEVPPGH